MPREVPAWGVFAQGMVPAWGGVCLVGCLPGGVSAWGSLPGGWCLPGWCLPRGVYPGRVVSAQGGGGVCPGWVSAGRGVFA